MRNFRLLFAAIGLACVFSGKVMSQDDVQVGDAKVYYQSSVMAPHGANANNLLWAGASSGGYPSADSQYLAQEVSELQTYEDLGMQFHFLQSAAIRRQLKLPEEQGLLIESVDTEKAGHKAGFAEGDLILVVGLTPVDTQYDFVIEVNGKRGEDCPVEIRRDGEPHTLTIHLDPIDPVTLETEGRWIIGVHVEAASEALQAQLLSTGTVITELTENAPAVTGGLKVHDVIARINGNQIATPEDLRKVVGESGGQPVRLEFYRGGKLQSLDLTPIREQPEEVASHTLTLLPNISGLEGDAHSASVGWLLANRMPASPDPALSQILERIEQLSRDVQEIKDRLK